MLLAHLAKSRPLVLVLDDLHWSDGASIELLAALLRRRADVPVLANTTIPSLGAPWALTLVGITPTANAIVATGINVLAVAWLALETVNIAWPRTSLALAGAPAYQVWAAPLALAVIATAGLAYLACASPTAGSP